MKVVCCFVSLFLYLCYPVALVADENGIRVLDGNLNKKTPDSTGFKQSVGTNSDSGSDGNRRQEPEKYHVVQAGDNIYRLSIKYNVSRQDLIKLNNLNDTSIKVGQKLLIPTKLLDDNKNSKVDNKSVNNTQSKAEDKKDSGDKVLDLNKIVDDKNSGNSKFQQSLINNIDSTTFIWPSRGVILFKFGHQMRTGRLEGISISVETGSAVHASSSGVVVYSDEIVGYGNVVLIRHYNGFFTAYGHTDPVVIVGDKVKKGQIIAHVSKNKQSKKSLLYFSIRKNGKSYDPEKIIQTKISN